MPPSGLEISGLLELRGAGISDPFLTARFAQTTYTDVAAVAATITVNEAGVYEIQGHMMRSAGATRHSVFIVQRGGSQLQLGRLAANSTSPAVRTDRHVAYLEAGDQVRLIDAGGALGDAGVVEVTVRRLGR